MAAKKNRKTTAAAETRQASPPAAVNAVARPADDTASGVPHEAAGQAEVGPPPVSAAEPKKRGRPKVTKADDDSRASAPAAGRVSALDAAARVLEEAGRP